MMKTKLIAMRWVLNKRWYLSERGRGLGVRDKASRAIITATKPVRMQTSVVTAVLTVVSLFQGTMLGRCPLRASNTAPSSLVRS